MAKHGPPVAERALSHNIVTKYIKLPTLANVSFLVALERAPGYIIFPAISIGAILLASLLAVFLWAERYRGKVVLRIVIAVFALILINIPLELSSTAVIIL